MLCRSGVSGTLFTILFSWGLLFLFFWRELKSPLNGFLLNRLWQPSDTLSIWAKCRVWVSWLWLLAKQFFLLEKTGRLFPHTAWKETDRLFKSLRGHSKTGACVKKASFAEGSVKDQAPIWRSKDTHLWPYIGSVLVILTLLSTKPVLEGTAFFIGCGTDS